MSDDSYGRQIAAGIKLLVLIVGLAACFIVPWVGAILLLGFLGTGLNSAGDKFKAWEEKRYWAKKVAKEKEAERAVLLDLKLTKERVRRERIAKAGKEFTEAINDAWMKGMTGPQLEELCRQKWGIECSIGEGQLKVDDDTLYRIETYSLVDEMKAALRSISSSDRQIIKET